MTNRPKKILMRVRVYYDALNFYHRVAKENKFKWIDIKRLLLELLEMAFRKEELKDKIKIEFEIEGIYLFTALIKGNPEGKKRQEEYLGALHEAYGGDILKIVDGRMVPVNKTGKPKNKVLEMIANIVGIIRKRKGLIRISTYEEKKTDVNIACQMVHDAHTAAGKEFDVACLVSNDSDFESPLMIKKESLWQRTLLISPLSDENKGKAAKNLKRYAHRDDRIPYISRKILLKHRLPLQVGKWRCPEEWIEQDRRERERRGEPPPPE